MTSPGYFFCRFSAARGATPSCPPKRNTRSPRRAASLRSASPKEIPATRSRKGVPCRFAARSTPDPSASTMDAELSSWVYSGCSEQARSMRAFGVYTRHVSPPRIASRTASESVRLSNATPPTVIFKDFSTSFPKSKIRAHLPKKA